MWRWWTSALLLIASVTGWMQEAGRGAADTEITHSGVEIASTSSAVDGVSAEQPRGNRTITSFNTAKRDIAKVFQGHEVTFYCGCRYEQKKIELASCGYVSKSGTTRAKRLEWEHVVPAENFGRSFVEWREGHPKCVDNKGNPFTGRNCASKVSLLFRYMEADLYNLQPAIGEVNARRSNYRFDMISGEEREFGACDIEIADRRVEPRPAIRGDIARTYLYMEWAYGRRLISSADRKLFEAWNREDPVDEWERERARRIAAIQGNVNPFIK